MEKQAYFSKIKSYLQLNWFKLTLLGMLVFVFLRKDLSFQFNINSPSHIEQNSPRGTEQMPINDKGKKGELLTHKKAIPKTDIGNRAKTSQTTVLSAIDFPSFSRSTPEESAAAELAQVDKKTKERYISRFGHVALSESKKYGIPASIILANAILHSSYGQGDLARNGNNHFKIPCTNKWLGESGTYHDACYRHYENAWSSFRDHSLYLTSGRFAKLRQLPANDYRAWAKALEELNYSDIYNDLAKRLIQIIELSNLQAMD